jgi:hypothetical protein
MKTAYETSAELPEWKSDSKKTTSYKFVVLCDSLGRAVA